MNRTISACVDDAHPENADACEAWVRAYVNGCAALQVDRILRDRADGAHHERDCVHAPAHDAGVHDHDSR